MENHTFTLTGPCTITDSSNNVTTETRNFGFDVVSHGPLVLGDHKSPNNWSYTCDRRSYARGSLDNIWNGWKYRSTVGVLYDGSESSKPSLPTWDQRDLVYNKALDKLNERVRGSMDVSIDAFQAKMTLQMIKGITTAKGLAENLRSLKDPTKFASNTWLQWTYGWKPTLSTIYDAAEELIRHNLNNIVVIKGSNRLEEVISGNETLYLQGRPFSFANSGTKAQACRFKVRLRRRDAFEVSRWTSLNPLSIGYELVPYSFVLDWFYDVGSFLRATETALAYNPDFIDGFATELFAYDKVSSIKDGYHSSPWGEAVILTCEQKYRHRYMSRVKLTSYPFPRKPVLSTDLSSSRLLSAAALLRQLIRR